jgi:hypothetical protein
MLERRFEDFSGRDQLGYLLLGLLSIGDRVTALSALPRADGGRAEPGKLADFLLGVIATQRHLQRTLSTHLPVAKAGDPAPVVTLPSDPALLR